MNQKQQVGEDWEDGEDPEVYVELVVEVYISHDANVVLLDVCVHVGWFDIGFCEEEDFRAGKLDEIAEAENNDLLNFIEDIFGIGEGKDEDEDEHK